MRTASAALFALCLATLSGCPSITADDMNAPFDAAIVDRSAPVPDSASPADLASMPDLSRSLDLAQAPDLSTQSDLGSRPDLATAPDLAGNFAGAGDPCGQSANGRACAQGLVCCYPCGIPGCQYRCQTPCAAGPACINGCPLLP